MHIGYLTTEYPEISRTYGGIATSIKGLSEKLIEQGHDVTVFLCGEEENKVEHQGKLRIVSIKRKKVKGIGWWINRKHIEHIVNKAVKKDKIDLIEAPDWTGMTAFMDISCPVVIRLHGSDTYFCHIEKRPQKYKNFFLEKNALKRADHIISVSQYTAKLTSKLFGLSRPIKIIYNGIDTKKYSMNKNKVLKEANSILYLGTLIRKKGVLDLASVFNLVVDRYPDTKLYVAGADASDIVTGSSSTWRLMQDIMTPKALKNVYYMGKIPHEEIKDLLFRANICVFPSYAEAFPLSWLEAMAAQKPIVASNIGWAKECLEDGISGLLAHPSNHKLFARNIIKFIEDNIYAETMAKKARERVFKCFDINTIVESNLNFYQQVVEKKV